MCLPSPIALCTRGRALEGGSEGGRLISRTKDTRFEHTHTHILSLLLIHEHTHTHTLLHLVIPRRHDSRSCIHLIQPVSLLARASPLLPPGVCRSKTRSPQGSPHLLSCSLTSALHTLTAYPWFRVHHYLPCRLGPSYHHDSDGGAVHVTHWKQSESLTDHARKERLAASKPLLPTGTYLVIRMQSRSLAILQGCRHTKQHQLRHKSQIVTTELI